MTAREFLNRHQQVQGYVIAELTDTYLVDQWPLAQEHTLMTMDDAVLEQKVLEIRLFNEREEHKLFRMDTGRAYTARMLRDDADGVTLMVNGTEMPEAKTWDSFDEAQFLDVDARRSAQLPGGNVMSTGGGVYHLPFSGVNGAKVNIRYYVSRYPETGQVRIADWRVTGFTEGK